MKYRILFAVTNDLIHDRRMFRICNTLAESGADVTLVGRKFRTSGGFNPERFKGKRLSCFFNKGLIFYAEYNVRLFFYLLFRPFDILCACDLDTALPVTLVSTLKKKKCVYDAHEYFTEVPELTGRSLVKAVWELIARITIPRFDLQYTVGEELALIMGKKYDVFFHVIRNIPFDAVPIPSTEVKTSKRNILFYQGALNIGRGLEALLEAMKHLPDWECKIAGEGDITDKLKTLAKEYDISDRVKFLGWIHSKDLPSLMHESKLGINLREAGSLNDYYSLPNKFFDFIHAGLPSINMKYPEYERVCTMYPCALLIDHVSVEEILPAINRIETEAGLYESMVNACRQASMKFTWEKEGRKLVLLYEQLVPGNGEKGTRTNGNHTQ